jgi:ABC-2 type transport system ATP-binding protein
MIAGIQELELAPESAARGAGPVVASLQAVSKNFGAVRALKQVNFQVPAGELVALLGPNGAGKTTAVKLFLGLAKPDSGAVQVFGGNPVQPSVRARMGCMMQVAKVPETLRVREHLDLFSSYYSRPLPIRETLALAGLESIQNRLFGDLSGGQKQRVLFGLAICGNPDLLFLDEPTVGLDVESRRMFWDQIRRLVGLGKTIVLTTHYLEEADALADRIVVINRGEIIASGTPTEIKAKTSGRCIRCSSGLEADVIRKMPGVLEVRRDREVLEIRATEAEPVLRQMLLLDPNLKDVDVSSAGLEEAFLALTRDESHA